MAQLNLLPWREAQRRQQQRAFVLTSSAAVFASLLVVVTIHLLISQMINRQDIRNAYLSAQIQIMDNKIKKIDKLNATRRALLERMQVIQNLQQARPGIVHLFDAIAETTPSNVHLTQLEQQDATIVLTGMAESNASVSSYMRNIEDSAWLTKPTLSVISSQHDKQLRNSQFSLSLMQNNIPTGPSQ
ncbi:MAG: pilus assembly protein PilN [Candidatus Thioglobus sp.]|nr:MAG: pilus assembly protein PilN [Candidatus Thioglobus sp.]